jgi:plastocyanin
MFPPQSHIPAVSQLQNNNFLYFSISPTSHLRFPPSNTKMFPSKFLILDCVLTALNLLALSVAEKTASAATATTTPKILDVNVGNEEGALIFEPDIVTASLKDVINFHFYPINHSVAQSSFEKPCEPLAGGVGQLPIFSGFLPVKSGESVSRRTSSLFEARQC